MPLRDGEAWNDEDRAKLRHLADPASPAGRVVRCAIYTRKSADERPDSALGSIERQREMCAAYVASQAGSGWTLAPGFYDDEGYSGGTLRRPAVERLLEAIDAGQIDTVVVYKIDRLTRSLRDFVNLVDRLDRRGVAFVAVTQAFDTRTSMGRLTLNVLLSFAQFERELTSERLKDWFAGARQRGLWTNGARPYGYDVQSRRLVINEREAAVVRHTFRRYVALGSSGALAEELTATGHLNRQGRPFTGRVILSMLRNPVYRGKMIHRGDAVGDSHDAIVSGAEFRRANATIDSNARRSVVRPRPRVEGLLKDLIYAEDGVPLIHVFVRRSNHIYRYYVPAVVRYGPGTVGYRYRAGAVEAAIRDLLLPVMPTARDTGATTSGGIRRLISRVDISLTTATVTLASGGRLTAVHSGAIGKSHSERP